MARRKSHERSMGTMISTVCFFIMAVFFFLQSADFLDAGHTLKGYVLIACAIASTAAGLRFIIHNIISRFRGQK